MSKTDGDGRAQGLGLCTDMSVQCLGIIYNVKEDNFYHPTERGHRVPVAVDLS